MSALFDAHGQMTTTTNGMTAFRDTGNALVSLFFKIGTARGSDLTKEFEAAFAADPDKALRILMWVRDVRGGAGERQRFRDLMVMACDKILDQYGIAHVLTFLNRIPEIGRYDDLHSFVGTRYEAFALQVYLQGICSGNGLACKWAPRKGKIAEKLRKMWDVSPKFYRKHLVTHTQVVEQLMCAGKWDEINFSHIPSMASKIYAKALRRHQGERYQDNLNRVIAGEAKMNASAIFPHDIYLASRNDPQQANAQWKSLPNYLEGTDEKILVMADVSGSMMGMPMAVSVALGLYFSERLEGEFKNCVLTFSSKPTLVKLSGGVLSERIRELERIDWGGSTNIERAFGTVLETAVRFKISKDQMPTKILIVSDMQFNEASQGGTVTEMIKDLYEGAGYEVPSIVFWNVDSESHGNAPVRFDQSGVALVSGASPSVVKSVLGGEVDPVKVMLKTIMVDRYTLE